jgi:competence protein ComEA
VFLALGAALVGAIGYGLANRPSAVILSVLPPQPTPLPTLTATPGPVRCYIVGPVKKPGVYTLPPGALVEHAIQAAGGPTADADLEQLNLAAVVQDQDQITVPRRPVVPIPSEQGTPERPGNELVNINTADSETLQTLPGIGPILAERIIALRNERGPYEKIEDLINVKGIGTITLEKLSPLITVGR